MTPAVREQPVIEITRHRGWYRLPTLPASTWMPDATSALAVARHIWPGTSFRIVDDASGAALLGVPGNTSSPKGQQHRPVVDGRRLPPRVASSPRRQSA